MKKHNKKFDSHLLDKDIDFHYSSLIFEFKLGDYEVTITNNISDHNLDDFEIILRDKDNKIVTDSYKTELYMIFIINHVYKELDRFGDMFTNDLTNYFGRKF